MNAIEMIAVCMTRQVGDVACPSLGTPRPEADPVNHESLATIDDHGVDGHATSERGLDDDIVPPRPEQAAYA